MCSKCRRDLKTVKQVPAGSSLECFNSNKNQYPLSVNIYTSVSAYISVSIYLTDTYIRSECQKCTGQQRPALRDCSTTLSVECTTEDVGPSLLEAKSQDAVPERRRRGTVGARDISRRRR